MSILKRTKLENLLKWSKDKNRKPLMVYGSRQVGKTYLILELFARKYFSRKHYYVNFMTQPNLKNLLGNLVDARDILNELGSYFNDVNLLQKEDYLIIFDEIQEVPKLRTSLKSFNETMKGKHKIICTGSYLSNTLTKAKEGFPVGQVAPIHLQPLTFKEFLINSKKEWIVEKIYSNLESFFKNEEKEIDKSIHNTLIEDLKKYILLGGLPNALSVYFDNKEDFERLKFERKIVMSQYIADIMNYIGETPSERSESLQIYQQMFANIAKQNNTFVMSELDKKARYNTFKQNFNLLILSGLVYKLNLLSKPTSIFSGFNESKFKLYCSDVGLASEFYNLNMDKNFWLSTGINANIRGFLAENFVINEIAYHFENELKNFTAYFRFKDESKHYYEVDLLLEDINSNLIPIEIKSSYEFSKSSFNRYIHNYWPKYAIVFSFNNFSKYEVQSGDNKTIVYNIPLYCVGFLNYWFTRLDLFNESSKSL